MFWNLFFQTCLFLEEIHHMCKHHLMVVFHIFLWNVTICLSNVRLSLLIFTFTYRHATHSFVLLIFCFQFDPHVLISSNCLKGSSRVGSFGYSKGVFIIFHILFIMLEIKVYSIIVSKVFGVTIVVNSFCHCKIDV